MCSKVPSKFNCLQRFYPYLLCSVQSGLIMSAGDILAQIYIEKKDWDNFQYERTAKFAFIGMVFTGPLLCHWSSLARKYRGIDGAVNRTLSTQFYMAPALNFGTITMANALNGLALTTAEVKNILHEDFFTVMKKNFIVWLPTQFIGCLLECYPIKYLLTIAVSVAWYAYLSNLLMPKYENQPQKKRAKLTKYTKTKNKGK